MGRTVDIRQKGQQHCTHITNLSSTIVEHHIDIGHKISFEETKFIV